MHRDHGAILEPHGAVGWAGLMRFIADHAEHAGTTCISLETAHPAKFPEEVQAITGVDPALPPSLEGLDDGEESFGQMDVSYDQFKAHLQQEYQA